jgi:leucyl aminopeptidase (aminopeptidase T)
VADADLDRAVAAVVGRCLRVAPREDVLVVADPGTHALGEALRAAAAAARADVTLALIAERATHGSEPPKSVAAALAACDVFIAPTSKSLSHTAARKRASAAGARGATMPGVTADMLARVMAVDLETLGHRSRAVAELLDRAGEARLTCSRGSDLRLDLAGRPGIADDGDLSAAGAFGNLPCGEGFISPASGEGTLVVSTMARRPVELTVRDGALAGATTRAGRHFIDQLREHGEPGLNLAELGVGTNERATLTGNVLEDEKVLGTAHVAFGASAGIGGTVSAPIHLDVVITDVSLEIGGTAVLEDGRFVLG